MSTIRYNKLVRDRIPEIISNSDKRCVCRTLSDDEYIMMLDAKLNEEFEYTAAQPRCSIRPVAVLVLGRNTHPAIQSSRGC